MRERTLVTQRLYFGMDALELRAATTRVLARVVGLPPDLVRVSARNLRQDFEMNTVEGQALVDGLVAEVLLEPRTDGMTTIVYRILEFATARVEPLRRHRARELVFGPVEGRINAEWTRNPLEIEAVAPFGSYMSRDAKLAELPLAIVVRPRALSRRARWGRIATKADGARDMRAAFRELSSFIRVSLVIDRRLLPRPFAIVFLER
jgi:hypothetical protein